MSAGIMGHVTNGVLAAGITFTTLGAVKMATPSLLDVPVTGAATATLAAVTYLTRGKPVAMTMAGIATATAGYSTYRAAS